MSETDKIEGIGDILLEQVCTLYRNLFISDISLFWTFGIQDVY